MLHRKPPKPAAYNAKPGNCRYCGGILLDDQGRVRKRASWHEHCLDEYKAIYWPQETRRVVWERDHGQCAKCSRKDDDVRGAWHVDHRSPLIEANGNIEYWKVGNLDTLCLWCHSEKTANEATSRAEARRKIREKSPREK